MKLAIIITISMLIASLAAAGELGHVAAKVHAGGVVGALKSIPSAQAVTNEEATYQYGRSERNRLQKVRTVCQRDGVECACGENCQCTPERNCGCLNLNSHARLAHSGQEPAGTPRSESGSGKAEVQGGPATANHTGFHTAGELSGESASKFRQTPAAFFVQSEATTVTIHCIEGCAPCARMKAACKGMANVKFVSGGARSYPHVVIRRGEKVIYSRAGGISRAELERRMR